MFTFRGATEDAERLARRIRRVLERRHAMHVGELHMRLGVDRAALGAELEAMMERGEVGRLRPIDYSGNDHDFFRLIEPVAVKAKDESRRLSRPLNERRETVRLAGEAMTCFAG